MVNKHSIRLAKALRNSCVWLISMRVRAGPVQLLQPLEASERFELDEACDHTHHVKKDGTFDTAEFKSNDTISVEPEWMRRVLQPPTKDDEMLTSYFLEAAFRRVAAAGGAAAYIPGTIDFIVQLEKCNYEGWDPTGARPSATTLSKWAQSKRLVYFVRLMLGEGHTPETAGADYLLLPIHRFASRHWVLMVLDLKHKTLTVLDSCLMGDYGSRSARKDIKRVQAYLDFLAAREGGVIEWSNTFPSTLDKTSPAVEVAQQYSLGVPGSSGLDCGLFVLFYGAAITSGECLCSDAPFTQEDMPTLRQRAAQLVVGQLDIPRWPTCWAAQLVVGQPDTNQPPISPQGADAEAGALHYDGRPPTERVQVDTAKQHQWLDKVFTLRTLEMDSVQVQMLQRELRAHMRQSYELREHHLLSIVSLKDGLSGKMELVTALCGRFLQEADVQVLTRAGFSWEADQPVTSLGSSEVKQMVLEHLSNGACEDIVCTVNSCGGFRDLTRLCIKQQSRAKQQLVMGEQGRLVWALEMFISVLFTIRVPDFTSLKRAQEGIYALQQHDGGLLAAVAWCASNCGCRKQCRSACPLWCVFARSFKGVLNCRAVVQAAKLLEEDSTPDIIQAEAKKWLSVPAVAKVVLAKFLSLLKRGQHNMGVPRVEIAMDSKLTNMALNFVNPTMAQWASFFKLRKFELVASGLTPEVAKACAALGKLHKAKVECAVKRLRTQTASQLQDVLALPQKLCDALQLVPQDNKQVLCQPCYIVAAPLCCCFEPKWCVPQHVHH